MSTNEYHDLYLKCQDTGKYHIYVFDMIGSKKMSFDYRRNAQEKMIRLMNSIYEHIEYIEKYTNRKILVFEDDFVLYKSGVPYKGFGFKQEPFLFGDTFGFTIYRDTLSRETIYSIYEHYKKELGIDFDFHFADGYYETNDYSRDGVEYFRGCCIDLLSTLHKEDMIKELSILKKKLK